MSDYTSVMVIIGFVISVFIGLFIGLKASSRKILKLTDQRDNFETVYLNAEIIRQKTAKENNLLIHKNTTIEKECTRLKDMYAYKIEICQQQQKVIDQLCGHSNSIDSLSANEKAEFRDTVTGNVLKITPSEFETMFLELSDRFIIVKRPVTANF